MYTQFFGNYLLHRGAITPEQLMDAMKEESSSHIKLGTLAIHSGYMTASEVENIIIMQTHQDKRFGDLAVEQGYLTNDQVRELIETQNPNYLLLGQILIEKGYLTHSEFETLLLDYQSENEITEQDISSNELEHIHTLLRNFLKTLDFQDQDYIIQYLSLLFNNLIRFIGDDFSPLDPIPCEEIPITYCISQRIGGSIQLLSGLELDEPTVIAFASRYVGDTFTEFDEYVKASVEDFLNLHNGLFNVNMSNNNSIELSLDPPMRIEDPIFSLEGKSYLIPIAYPFGILNFILAF
ncbi:MAG: chemotaxis protein CheX [Lachnospiraceae bacterium]